ncbi:hypothetical protein J421_5325 (plasmid) [Gemmatirosa kalamazoonensis]|uniref:Uncharacterized protein n=1 Tax=Gemmatirosa kalamazoonensis TaxID=861299 RepID=W0RRB7_9BACT|nr:hypothetical protein J421_5325 [Gemmatirosa kalamazoonensis]
MRAGAPEGGEPMPAPQLSLRAGCRGALAQLLAAAHVLAEPPASDNRPA